MNLTLVIQIIQAIIAAAPSVVEGVARAQAVIKTFFTSQIISAAEQDALKAHVDALGQLAALGVPPAAWTVEPDPV